MLINFSCCFVCHNSRTHSVNPSVWNVNKRKKIPEKKWKHNGKLLNSPKCRMVVIVVPRYFIKSSKILNSNEIADNKFTDLCAVLTSSFPHSTHIFFQIRINVSFHCARDILSVCHRVHYAWCVEHSQLPLPPQLLFRLRLNCHQANENKSHPLNSEHVLCINGKSNQ